MKKDFLIITCILLTFSTSAQKKYYLTLSYGHAAQSNFRNAISQTFGGVMSLSGSYTWNKNFSASIETELFSLINSRNENAYLENRKINTVEALFHLHTDYEKYFIADIGIGPMLKYNKWTLSTANNYSTIVFDNKGNSTDIEAGSIYQSNELSIGYIIQGGLFTKVTSGIYAGLQSQFQNDNWMHNTLTFDLALKLKL